jgi:hypothetical protein
VILVIVTVASLVKTGRDPSARAHAGAVLGSADHHRADREHPASQAQRQEHRQRG